MSEESKVHEYKGSDFTVTFEKGICQHAAVCVKTLPNVFNPKARPWVNTEGASKQEIQEMIANCPSKALKFVDRG